MSVGELDPILAGLYERKARWAAVGLRERADFLNACIAGVQEVAGEWVARVCRSKGIDPRSPLAGEAWLSGPMATVRCLRVTAQSLARPGAQNPVAVRERNGQSIAHVVPASRLEAALLAGIEADVWLLPGSEPTQARLYRDKAEGRRRDGGIALVLGAGNVSAIAPRDLVHKLVVDDEVVVLKMHPVNEYLGPLFERAFSPLIDAGYLAIVYGGAEVGQTLCRHELVDAIHLTGSHHTHDAIVWGDTADERDERKRAGDPVISKRVTSELGCVSPVMVVPGEWTESELEFQARSVAGMVTHNASFNCTAAKAVVVARDWPQRRRFLDRLHGVLAATPPRRAYYPGADGRHARFLDEYPAALALGTAAADGELPWTVLPDIEPRRSEYALQNEAFCGVVAEVAIDAAEPAAFLQEAVRVANDEIWGTLSCNLLVDPRTEKRLGAEIEAAVAALRYGGVAVNTWSSVLFGLSTTSWGAYPGNRLDDVGSGIGVVGNALLFDHPQKSVARAPFRQWPNPPWLPGHRTLDTLGRRWTGFEARPGWHKLPAIGWAAVRG